MRLCVCYIYHVYIRFHRPSWGSCTMNLTSGRRRADLVCFINLLFLHLHFHIPSVCSVVSFFVEKMFWRFFIIDHIDWWCPQVSTFSSPSFGFCVKCYCRIFARHNARYCAVVWCVCSFMAHNKWHAVWPFHCVLLPCHLYTMETCTLCTVICRFKYRCKGHTQKKDNGSNKNRELTFARIKAATKCHNANGKYQWPTTVITATTAITVK